MSMQQGFAWYTSPPNPLAGQAEAKARPGMVKGGDHIDSGKGGDYIDSGKSGDDLGKGGYYLDSGKGGKHATKGGKCAGKGGSKGGGKAAKGKANHPAPDTGPVRRGGWFNKCQAISFAVLQEDWQEAMDLAEQYYSGEGEF